MHIADGIENIASPKTGCVVALGNFDGFHRGHQVVVGEAGRLAAALNLPLVVVVTEPHPIRFFQPAAPAFRLTEQQTRAQLLKHFGVSQLVVLPFDKNLAAMSAQNFVLDLLVNALKSQHVVVGYDYRFGSKRGGGTSVLAHMGLMEDFGLSIIEPVMTRSQTDKTPDIIYSSTTIREALKAGDLATANQLLGHTWRISGTVQNGDARGRTIGFPTANVSLGDLIEPALGVYAVRCKLEGRSETINGVANIGRRPTFDKRDVLLEVHLFDFNEDIYGKQIDIDVLHKLRPEKKFDGLDSLKAQISADCDDARLWLSTVEDTEWPTLKTYLDQNPKFPE